MSDEVLPVQTQTDGPAKESHRAFVGHAKVIGGFTLISRVLGLVREILFAHFLGMRAVASAFTIAWCIPNLFRRLFGEGALSAAFIPLYAKSVKEHDADAAREFAAASVNLLFVALLALTLLGEAVLVSMALFWPMRFERLLAVQLTAIMLPYALLICSTAFLSAILQVHRRFGLPAAAPIVLNVCHIAVMIVGAKLLNVRHEDSADSAAVTQLAYWMAGFVLLAGVLQVSMLLPALRAVGFRFALRKGFWTPAVKRMLVLSIPVALGAGVLQVSVLLDKLIAWLMAAGPSGDHFVFLGRSILYPMAEGAAARLDRAQYLYQFPLGVFAIALATAIFPTLSANALDKDRAQFRRVLRQGIESSMLEGIAASLGLILVSGPLVKLLFLHGNTQADDVRWISLSLCFYSAAIWAFSLQQILNRAYYALHDMVTPLVMSAVTLAVNLAVELPLVFTPLKEAGMAAGTCASFVVQVVVMTWLVDRRVGGLGLRESLPRIVRMAVAGAVMFGACWGVQQLAVWPKGETKLVWIAQLAALLAVGGVTYLGACAAMGIHVREYLFPRRKGVS